MIDVPNYVFGSLRGLFRTPLPGSLPAPPSRCSYIFMPNGYYILALDSYAYRRGEKYPILSLYTDCEAILVDNLDYTPAYNKYSLATYQPIINTQWFEDVKKTVGIIQNYDKKYMVTNDHKTTDNDGRLIDLRFTNDYNEAIDMKFKHGSNITVITDQMVRYELEVYNNCVKKYLCQVGANPISITRVGTFTYQDY